MAEIVVFHSALGLRPGTRRDAGRLRAAGHVVHVPDLYDGHVFSDADDGVTHADRVGWPTLLDRADAAVAGLPAQLVVVGQSLGVGLATHVATSRPGVRAALLCFAGQPPEAPWPSGVPAQVHHAVDDRWAETGSTAALVAAVARAGAAASLHLYPGARHLFTDADLPDDYDAANAELFWSRALPFLDSV